jgi:dCMP deaminase
LLPNFPDLEVRGHWTEKSQLAMQRIIEPVPYKDVAAVMKSFATTLTTPASSSEWATAKPWEAFALGSICFFHPRYDGQGHILPLKGAKIGDVRAETLAQYLRVDNAEQLVERVNEVMSQPELYHTIVTEQRRFYEAAFARWNGGTRAIADRIVHDLTGDDELEEVWTTRTEPPAAKVASRGEARPRGTNEERKRKPPVSRRRKLRPEMLENVEPIATEEEPAVETSSLDVDEIVEECKTQFAVTARQDSTGEPVVLYRGRTDAVSYTVPKGFSEVSIGLTRNFAGSFLNYNGPGVITQAQIDGGTISTPLPKVRPSKDVYFLGMAKHVATQSTCARRAVGCVLVDANKKVLATGFNGVPRGFDHCNEGRPCPGANAASGENLDGCYSAHAETNAIIQCGNCDQIDTVYVTVSPCTSCVKMLLNTGARRIVFEEEYVQPAAKELWLRRPGNEWVKL